MGEVADTEVNFTADDSGVQQFRRCGNVWHGLRSQAAQVAPVSDFATMSLVSMTARGCGVADVSAF